MRQLMFKRRCRKEKFDGKSRIDWINEISQLYRDIRDEKIITENVYNSRKELYIRKSIFEKTEEIDENLIEEIKTLKSKKDELHTIFMKVNNILIKLKSDKVIFTRLTSSKEFIECLELMN